MVSWTQKQRTNFRIWVLCSEYYLWAKKLPPQKERKILTMRFFARACSTINSNPPFIFPTVNIQTSECIIYFPWADPWIMKHLLYTAMPSHFNSIPLFGGLSDPHDHNTNKPSAFQVLFLRETTLSNYPTCVRVHCSVRIAPRSVVTPFIVLLLIKRAGFYQLKPVKVCAELE